MFGARRFHEMASAARVVGDWCIDRASHMAAAAHRWPLVLAVVAGTAVAAPPQPGSEDANIMAGHGEWVHSLRSAAGVSCCDESDCRPVEARATSEGWQVRWRPGQLEGAPTEWTPVPPEAVLARENPVGMPVACWYGGRVACFVPGGAT